MCSKIGILTLSLQVKNSESMSEIAYLVDALEDKVRKLLNKLEDLEKDTDHLKQELRKAARIINQQSSEMNALKTQNDALKLANSLLGSAENKKDTKFKINSLIREIDYCIKRLSDQ